MCSTAVESAGWPVPHGGLKANLLRSLNGCFIQTMAQAADDPHHAESCPMIRRPLQEALHPRCAAFWLHRCKRAAASPEFPPAPFWARPLLSWDAPVRRPRSRHRQNPPDEPCRGKCSRCRCHLLLRLHCQNPRWRSRRAHLWLPLYRFRNPAPTAGQMNLAAQWLPVCHGSPLQAHRWDRRSRRFGFCCGAAAMVGVAELPVEKLSSFTSLRGMTGASCGISGSFAGKSIFGATGGSGLGIVCFTSGGSRELLARAASAEPA